MDSRNDESRLLLTESEAAKRLGVSSWTLLRFRQVGGRRAETAGPAFVKIGKSIRYRPADLERWIENQIIDPGAAKRPGRPRKVERSGSAAA